MKYRTRPVEPVGGVQAVSEIIRQAIADGPPWLNQRLVAREAGISEKHLSQIMRGSVRMSARVAVQLEGPLGVSALDLLYAQAAAEIAAVKCQLNQPSANQ